MPPKKKKKPLTVESIKAALLPAMAELFESHATRADDRFKAVHQEIHGAKIMIEQMDKKIDTAIELASTANNNTDTVKDHSQRLKKLETEVDVLKQTVKTTTI